MTRTRMLRSGTVVVALLFAGAACGGESEAGGEAETATGAAPAFEPEPSWPTLPADWEWGQVLGIRTDGSDHVWVTDRGRISEFDADGELVQSWSARDANEEWTVIHGLFVDHNGYVWTNAREQHQALKFTSDGELVLTIGEFGETGGSDDPNLLGRPAEMWVDPDTNELFIADGYANRRIVVYDAETGDYLRHWGAYGEEPDDEYEPPPADAGGAPSREFGVVHGIVGSNDGLIYVGDRTNNRVQVFEKDGTYVAERVVPGGQNAGFSVALSPDPDQEFLYVADGTLHTIWILRRDGLEVVGRFGTEGSGPGQLGRPHNLTADSRGNVYVAEAEPGRRAQKFAFRGTAAP